MHDDSNILDRLLCFENIFIRGRVVGYLHLSVQFQLLLVQSSYKYCNTKYSSRDMKGTVSRDFNKLNLVSKSAEAPPIGANNS